MASVTMSPVTEVDSFLTAIRSVPGVRAGWVERIPELPITGDRAEAMHQLRPHHQRSLIDFMGGEKPIFRAEQVHGNCVAVVPKIPQVIAKDGLPWVLGVDGLITAELEIALVIYVADCGVIWLVDSKTGAIGLLHSGKKGTEANIFQQALDAMSRNFGTRAADVTAVLGPCIRPPDYEVDFAAEIGRQADCARVGNFIDCELNTASDLSRFYSYRKESGKTGRMMAMITRASNP